MARPKKRMVDNPLDVEQLRERVQASSLLRQQIEGDWSLAFSHYRGEATSSKLTYLDNSPYTRSLSPATLGFTADVNQVKALVDTIYTMSTSSLPKIEVFPRSPDDADRAQHVEGVVNYWWRTHGAQDQFRLAALDAVIIGHGWVKCEWKHKMETQPQSDEDIEKAVQLELERLTQAMETDESLVFESTETEDEIRERVTRVAQQTPIVISDVEYPAVRRVSPWNMYMDPLAEDWANARWVCERSFVSKTHAMNNPAYRQSSREALMATDPHNLDSETTYGTSVYQRSANIAEADEVVEIYEFHDLENGWWCQFHRNSNDFLLDPRPSPLTGSQHRSMYEQIRNYETGDLYPQGDVIQIAALQTQLDEVYTQLLAHIQQMNSKYLIHGSVSTEGVEQALASNKPQQAVSLPLQPNQSVRDVVFPVPVASATFDLVTIANNIVHQMEAITGVNELTRGTSQVERRTAAEAKILHSAASGRAAQKMEKTQRAAARIAGVMVALAQTLQSDGPRFTARTSNDKSRMGFVEYDRAAIQGMFDVEVEVGSMAPRDEMTQRQNLLMEVQLLQTPMFAQFIDMRTYLKERVLPVAGIESPEKFLKSEEQIQQEMMAAQAAEMGGVPETANEMLTPLQSQAAETNTPIEGAY